MGVSKIQLGTEPNTTWSPRTRDCQLLHLKATFTLCLSPVVASNNARDCRHRPSRVLAGAGCPPRHPFPLRLNPFDCASVGLIGCSLAHPVELPPLRPCRSHADDLQPPCVASSLVVGTILSGGHLPQRARTSTLIALFRADISFHHLNTLTVRTATGNLSRLLWYCFRCPTLTPLRTLS